MDKAAVIPSFLKSPVLTVAGDARVAPASQAPQRPGHAWAFAAYASNILFAMRSTDYCAPDVGRDPLLHTWSLSVEEQFYLFFAPLLLVLVKHTMRRGNREFLRRFRIVIIVGSILSFVG